MVVLQILYYMFLNLYFVCWISSTQCEHKTQQILILKPKQLFLPIKWLLNNKNFFSKIFIPKISTICMNFLGGIPKFPYKHTDRQTYKQTYRQTKLLPPTPTQIYTKIWSLIYPELIPIKKCCGMLREHTLICIFVCQNWSKMIKNGPIWWKCNISVYMEISYSKLPDI